jgi:hypothetical protein
MSDVKKAKPVQWFVECDTFTNEALERELAERGLGHDSVSKHIGMEGSDGKPHDVLAVPAPFIRKLLAAKKRDSRFVFKFWKRNGPEGVISPGDFLKDQGVRRTAPVKSAAAQLNAIVAKRAGKPAKPAKPAF